MYSSTSFLGALRKHTKQPISPMIYKANIDSHIMYGAESWGYCKNKHIKSMQTIQNRAVRLVGDYTYRVTPKFNKYALMSIKTLVRFTQLMFLFRQVNHVGPKVLNLE